MHTESNQSQSPAEPPPELPLPVRLANVYAAPGEVFDAVRGQPPNLANWLVPAVMAALAGMISVWVMFSQPAILQQMEDLQAERYQRLVDDGKMTQQQVDQLQQRMGSLQMTIGRIAGMVGALLMGFIWLFLLALVFHLMLRWVFHSPLSYLKTVEIVGLSLMIGVLGGLVNTLLMVITGSMFANLGPVLLINDFDTGDKLHLLASSVNLFTLWWLGVLAMGLARVSDLAFSKLALTLFGLWAMLRLIIVVSGIGSSGM
jgi:hypothetical protein